MTGEFELIRRLTSRLKLPKQVLTGPGDDAAVVRLGNQTLLLTTDLLIEGIHFRRDWASSEEIGFKAMRVNLSDIAAMGGRPRFALVSVGLPKGFRDRDAGNLFRGLRRAGEEAGTVIVGGDTNASDRLIVNVALAGEPGREGRILTRAGAKSGDFLYVTGELGGSALGLKALREKRRAGCGPFIARHKRPPLRVGVGLCLARLSGIHALVDLSDGLAGDLPHLLKASRVGCEVWTDKLPAVRAAPLGLLVTGGEDYELLFTASSRVKIPAKIDGVPVAKIGMITPNPGVLKWLRGDGTPLKADFKGFRHF